MRLIKQLLPGLLLAAGLSAVYQANAATPKETLSAKKQVAPKEAPSTKKQIAPKQSTIEVVFVLDTTGSMSGLIAGAKQKIWSIVNELANAKPTPKIKVGLVGYRDLRDQYVTKVFQMTDDLDSMYGNLMAFQAQGGGDFPEHVNKALFDGVHKIQWNRDPKALKLLFLVGDAPPHMDYAQDIHYPTTLQAAVKKGIIINTIRCGGNHDTATHWQKIANLGEGTFLTILHNGHAHVTKTPYDKDLRALGSKLQSTYIPYGHREARRKLNLQTQRSDSWAGRNSESSVARYSYNAKRSAAGHGWGSRDLLACFAKGASCMDKLSVKDLPEKLAKMSKKQRLSYLKMMMQKRKDLQKKVVVLSKKRDAYIKNKRKHEKNSFDNQVLQTMKRQAAKKDIHF
ncbi:MAG: VWA domain-containing protein [Myxococcales bacterium]|nr:VWA domain-containing protein [Myxococcales bacterium]